MNNITAAEVVIVSAGLLFLFSLVIFVDRYLTQRRSATQNADYLARIYAESENYSFRRPVFSQRPEWEESVFDIGGISVRSLSRRSVVRDHLGRVIALHNEEILTPEAGGGFSQPRRRLLLPAAA